MPWRRLAALFTVANAQLVVDWTAKSTFSVDPPRHRLMMYTQVEAVVGASVVGTIYSD
jgi:hypothetical protein